MPKTDPFDKYTDQYESWFEKHQDIYEAEIRAIKKLLPEFKNGIEVGVGSGLFASQLGIHKGVEPSETMAKKSMARGIDVAAGVAEHLEFEARTFDLLLMVTTICFVDDALKSLKEAHRVLQAGGVIILGFVDADSAWGRLYEKKKPSSKFYGDATFYSTDQLITLCRQAGFGNFALAQTLLGDPGNPSLELKDGYGQGGFVALRAQRQA